MSFDAALAGPQRQAAHVERRLLQASPSRPTGARPGSLSVGDFDCDGRPDLAWADLDALTVEVLPSGGAPGATLPTAFAPTYTAVADFDGDGRADIAVALGTGADSVLLLLNRSR